MASNNNNNNSIKFLIAFLILAVVVATPGSTFYFNPSPSELPEPSPAFIAAPRQLFLPPPEPECRPRYVKIDGICRPVLSRESPVLIGSIGTGGGILASPNYDAVNGIIFDDSDSGSSNTNEQEDNSLSTIEDDLTTPNNNKYSGVRVPKRPAPGVIIVPKHQDLTSDTIKCPSGTVNVNGQCRRKFRG